TEVSDLKKSIRAVRRRLNSLVEEDKLVRVVVPLLYVYEAPDSSSAVVGTAVDGEYHVLLDRDDSWLHVTYGDSSGWVEDRYALVVDRADIPSSRGLWDYAGLLIVGAFLIIATLIILLGYKFAFRRARRAKRHALIIARKTKYIKSLKTRAPATLDECFAEIGFAAHRAERLEIAVEWLERRQPDVILVDWKFSRNAARAVESLLLSRAATSSILTIFYNVPDPDAAHGLIKLGNARYLGSVFTDRELFGIVTPQAVSGRKARYIRKSVEAFALEGDIHQEGLVPIFQLIEAGSKTGCLFVDDASGPRGMVFVENGIITYATTQSNVAKPAVEELLGMRAGHFRFDSGRRTVENNCTVPIMQVLMEWAQKVDETGR
ncbi:MAG: DUF4388 domain-containing protein, partial [Chitinivibrionales bacterium]|nr:DUF4388 domain-containing protein [Chitinivibrionales bacterium]MBD3394041.1 DUF4388 domain-containing protein [Chitinivibrionales bacterium]